jgi:hypothetical protein
MTDKWDGTGSGYEAVLEARERAERQIVERNRRVLRYGGGVTDSNKTTALFPRYVWRTPWMGGPDLQDYRAAPWLDDDGSWQTYV